MSHKLDFWRTLAARLAAGERVFLALVAENTRHSPGTAGARLLRTASGETLGTIGGGIMEHRLLARADEVLRRGEAFAPEIRTLHHRRDTAGEPSGMICAGRQTNLYAVVDPEEQPIFERVIEIVENESAGRLRIDRDGFAVEDAAPDPARPAIVLERRGEDWTYREELLSRRRVAVLGGGHCGAALARTLAWLGYDVAVFETRSEVVTEALRADARVELVDDFRDAGTRIAHPELTRVVVMTHDVHNDVRALGGVLDRPFRFAGVMGAPAKLREIFRRLREEGAAEADLRRVQAPIGLEIGSGTPQEIAVSVAAQLIKLDS